MVSVHDEDETERAERLARWRAEQAVHRWYSDQATLNSATFPIYAAEDWLARINGQGSSNGQLTQITIAHAESMPDPLFAGRPPIEITTSINTYPSEDLSSPGTPTNHASSPTSAKSRPTGSLTPR